MHKSTSYFLGYKLNLETNIYGFQKTHPDLVNVNRFSIFVISWPVFLIDKSYWPISNCQILSWTVSRSASQPTKTTRLPIRRCVHLPNAYFSWCRILLLISLRVGRTKTRLKILTGCFKMQHKNKFTQFAFLKPYVFRANIGTSLL